MRRSRGRVRLDVDDRGAEQVVVDEAGGDPVAGAGDDVVGSPSSSAMTSDSSAGSSTDANAHTTRPPQTARTAPKPRSWPGRGDRPLDVEVVGRAEPDEADLAARS